MRRLRKIWHITEKPYSSENHSSKLDIWLSRLSHVSQFGLFALTIGALYFTVIPLYKTAALEESIARRESELSVTNERLQAAAAELRKVNGEIYKRDRKEVVEQMVLVSALCSGLLEPPRTASSMKGKEIGESLLMVDAAQCLRREFKESKAEKILTVDDYAYLNNTMDEISGKLAEKQKQASLDIDSVPERAAIDPSVLTQAGEGEESLDQLIQEISPNFINEKVKQKTAISRTQIEIASDFAKAVLHEISSLRNIEWPDRK